MNKKTRQFAKVARKYGFVLSRHKTHCIWVHPDTGARVVSASSTSDFRAVKNFESRLRKATTDPSVFQTFFKQ
ncbi:MAG: type II toxin-antitoxin system HicA family toxin [Planctomycetota bacterium]|nr:type II toxin-antitoxin system HicA family toxin [Planctomycetota bacterium]